MGNADIQAQTTAQPAEQSAQPVAGQTTQATPPPARRTTKLMTEEEHVEKRLDEQQCWYSKKATWNQKSFRELRIIEVILAAGIPFGSSLVIQYHEITYVVAFVAFVIAAASGVLALYKFQDNWVEYRGTAEALKREKYLFLTRTSPYDVPDPFHMLVERVEGLLSKESAGWGSYMRQAGTQTTQPPQQPTHYGDVPLTPAAPKPAAKPEDAIPPRGDVSGVPAPHQ